MLYSMSDKLIQYFNKSVTMKSVYTAFNDMIDYGMRHNNYDFASLDSLVNSLEKFPYITDEVEFMDYSLLRKPIYFNDIESNVRSYISKLIDIYGNVYVNYEDGSIIHELNNYIDKYSKELKIINKVDNDDIVNKLIKINISDDESLPINIEPMLIDKRILILNKESINAKLKYIKRGSYDKVKSNITDTKNIFIRVKRMFTKLQSAIHSNNILYPFKLTSNWDVRIIDKPVRLPSNVYDKLTIIIKMFMTYLLGQLHSIYVMCDNYIDILTDDLSHFADLLDTIDSTDKFKGLPKKIVKSDILNESDIHFAINDVFDNIATVLSESTKSSINNKLINENIIRNIRPDIKRAVDNAVGRVQSIDISSSYLNNNIARFNEIRNKFSDFISDSDEFFNNRKGQFIYVLDTKWFNEFNNISNIQFDNKVKLISNDPVLNTKHIFSDIDILYTEIKLNKIEISKSNYIEFLNYTDDIIEFINNEKLIRAIIKLKNNLQDYSDSLIMNSRYKEFVNTLYNTTVMNLDNINKDIIMSEGYSTIIEYILSEDSKFDENLKIYNAYSSIKPVISTTMDYTTISEMYNVLTFYDYVLYRCILLISGMLDNIEALMKD